MSALVIAPDKLTSLRKLEAVVDEPEADRTDVISAEVTPLVPLMSPSKNPTTISGFTPAAAPAPVACMRTRVALGTGVAEFPMVTIMLLPEKLVLTGSPPVAVTEGNSAALTGPVK
jgi:hypothetical protein